MSSRDGIRVTTADAYLPVGGTPSNLTIRADAQVADVVFEARAPQASGSWTGRSSKRAGSCSAQGRTAARRSSCARASDRPTTCARVGIPVRLDLPGVGANLADHGGVDIDCGYRGPARTAPILHLLATFHSAATSSDEAPDLMLWLSDPRGDPPIFEIDVGLLKPRSRGSVRLRSADPADPPCIELPHLRDPFDVERLAEGYLRGLEVATDRRSDACVPTRSHPSAPGADELPDLIRANGYSFPHVVGTCCDGPAARRRRGGRYVGTRPRHGAAQRRRRLDRAQRALGIHPHPDDHDRRAPLAADRLSGLTGWTSPPRTTGAVPSHLGVCRSPSAPSTRVSQSRPGSQELPSHTLRIDPRRRTIVRLPKSRSKRVELGLVRLMTRGSTIITCPFRSRGIGGDDPADRLQIACGALAGR